MRHFAVVFILGVTCLCSAQTLRQEATNMVYPVMGGSVDLSKGLSFGAFSIVGAGGRQILAGDKPCGVVMGAGNFLFNVTDRFSIPVAERNAKHISRAKMQGTIKHAVVWSYDDLGTPTNQETGGPVPWLKDVVQNFQFDLPPSLLINGRLMNAKGVVYVLMQVADSFGDRYYVYRRDPVITKMEELWVLDKATNNTSLKAAAGDYLPYRLAVQPLNRQWYERFPAPTVATYEKIQIDNQEKDFVRITTTTRLQVMEDGVGVWRANLIQNFVDNRLGIRPNRVTRVRVDDKEADHLHISHQLFVDLGRPYKAGETITVVTVNEGDFAIHPNGNQYWSLGTKAWYPQPDLNGELAMLEMVVRAPKPLQPFASGARVKMEDQGTHTVLHTRLEKPIQFPVAAAGKWELFASENGGKKCNVGTYVIARKKGAERLMNNFFVAAGYYEQLFGVPYPFDDLTILEVAEWGLGQAPPGIIFLSQEAFDTRSTVVNQLFSQGVNERFAHEVAHAWWGHVVKMDSLEEQWLSESFAEYSAALFIKTARGGKKGQAEFKKIVKHWQGNTRLIRKGGSIYLANYLAFYEDQDWSERRFLLYNKGPLVLHALRGELKAKFGEEQGDRIFFTLLRSFVTNFQNRWGATQHVIGILNQITADNWQPWFDRYVYGSEVPKVKI